MPPSAEDVRHAAAHPRNGERRDGLTTLVRAFLAVAAERRTPVDLDASLLEVDEPHLAQLGLGIERQLERPIVAAARVHHLDAEEHVARARMRGPVEVCAR